ncbi:MAG: hypothetical protein WBF45_19110, partial [Acidobacteriaceae bacterium]
VGPARQNSRAGLRPWPFPRITSGSQIVVRWTILGRAPTAVDLLRRRRQNLCPATPSVIVVDQIELPMEATTVCDDA